MFDLASCQAQGAWIGQQLPQPGLDCGPFWCQRAGGALYGRLGERNWLTASAAWRRASQLREFCSNGAGGELGAIRRAACRQHMTRFAIRTKLFGIRRGRVLALGLQTSNCAQVELWWTLVQKCSESFPTFRARESDHFHSK